MIMKHFAFKLAGLCAMVVALAGCATTFVVDSNVQAFSSLQAVPAAPTYRFERLPSQQEPGQAEFEALADGALHKAGLRRDDSNARYTVQLTGRTQRIASPWADPWDSMWGGGFRWGRRSHFGLMGRMESPWFHREAAIVVRELSTNKVVFESRSVHDGPWMDSRSVFPAMFDAALQGFPQPPSGPRRIEVTVGTPGPSGK